MAAWPSLRVPEVWHKIPEPIQEMMSGIQIFNYLVKLAPWNQEVEEAGVRTALYGAARKQVQSLQTLADHLRTWYNMYRRYTAFRDVVVDSKALKSVLVDMVKPVISVPDANGVTLSQKIFFAQGMKQTQLGDNSATLTLTEYYEVAIQYAQLIPHPKAVDIKLFYTSSEHQADQGNGTGNAKGGKGSKGGNGKGAMEMVAGANMPRGLTHWTAP